MDDSLSISCNGACINATSANDTLLNTDSVLASACAIMNGYQSDIYPLNHQFDVLEFNTVYYGEYRVFRPEDIVDVQFFPRVVKMKFKNGVTTIAKLQEGDDYNKETGMMICIMEYIFQNKRYNNLFRKWIKHDEKRKADKVKAEKRAEEEKNIKKRQEEKKARKKAERKAKAKKEAIEICNIPLPEREGCPKENYKYDSEEISVSSSHQNVED